MLERLSLRNFKVFRDQEFLFPEGTTAIVGPNGSGKTTILEAIEFALFRLVSRKEKRIPHMEELIKHGAKKAKVELEFVAPINRRVYRVVRTIHPGETKADLFGEDSTGPVESGPKRVDEEIVDLLGMDRNAFSALTYVRQGEIDRLARLTPSSRRTNLYSMMGLGIYDKTSDKVQKQLRQVRKELKVIEEKRAQLELVQEQLPTRTELSRSLEALSVLEQQLEDATNLSHIRSVLDKIDESLKMLDAQLTSEEFEVRPKELHDETEMAEYLRSILDSIPDVAENQLRPHIRSEARDLFRGIFGDRYSDLIINDDYEIELYDLQGNRVALMAASGGEDVCVNFALRVAVNTALQKHSIAGPPPGLIILDEPGSGLDAQRRRWLPEAISGLDSVDQVIVVTHMEELKEASDHVVTLTPQGKGRQPLVEVESE